MSTDFTQLFQPSKYQPAGDISVQMAYLGNVSALLSAIGVILEAKDSDLLTLNAASQLRGCTPQCLSEMCRNKTLPAFPIKKGKRVLAWLIRRKDLESMPPVSHPLALARRKRLAAQSKSLVVPSIVDSIVDTPRDTDTSEDPAKT